MFKEASPELVRKALDDSAIHVLGGKDVTEARESIERKVREARIAYEGGAKAAEYFLLKKQGERLDAYAQRLRWAAQVRLVKPIGDVFAALVYSHAPERQMWVGDKPKSDAQMAYEWLEWFRLEDELAQEPDDGDEEVNDELRWAYAKIMAKYRGMDAVMRRRRDGCAAVKLYPKEDGRYGIGIGVVDKYENALPIRDPDDPTAILGTLETWELDERNLEHRLYTVEGDACRIYVVNEHLDVLRDFGEWPIRALPFVYYGDGEPQLQDATIGQRDVINAMSLEQNIRLKQGFAQPVLSGNLLNTPDDKGHTVVGMDELLKLELNADFRFVSADAPLAEHRAAIAERFAAVMKQHYMPTDFYRDDATPEQPEAKKAAWTPTLIIRQELVDEAVCAEEEIGGVIAEWLASPAGEYYGVGEFNPDDVEVDVKFRKNPLPSDKRADEEKDRSAVAAGTMLLTEYIMRNGGEGLEPRQVGLKAYQLEQERKLTAPDFSGMGDPFGNTVDMRSDDEPDRADVNGLPPGTTLNEISLAAERFGRIGDVETVNALRDVMGGFLGIELEPLTTADLLTDGAKKPIEAAQRDAEAPANPTAPVEPDEPPLTPEDIQ